jgi:glycosyltransferase involved in cell wall biosynthesis
VKDPLVSILLPVFNAQETLGCAIRSVIQQNYENWELLVIDDGSTDESVSVSRTFSDSRIRVICSNRNEGLAVRLNQGIQLAHGSYIARMDADDVSYPDRLSRQIEWMEEHRDVDLLGTGAVAFQKDGDLIGKFRLAQTHLDICASPASGFPMYHPTWLGRATWFRRHQYHESFPRAQDYELLLRAFGVSKFACLPDVLVGYRRDNPKLRKLLASRLYCFQAVRLQSQEDAIKTLLIRAAFTMCVKALIDIFMHLAKLGDWLEKKKFLPVDEVQRQRWARVWANVR